MGKKTILVVGAVIFNEQNQVLCALRSSEMSSPNLWEFPGGKVENGESHKEALQREIIEELECEIEMLEQIENTFFNGERAVINLITYKARLVSGLPKPKEHEELRWLPLGDLHKLDWAPADIPTVHRLQENF